jgi:hypothetical protein
LMTYINKAIDFGINARYKLDNLEIRVRKLIKWLSINTLKVSTLET